LFASFQIKISYASLPLQKAVVKPACYNFWQMNQLHIWPEGTTEQEGLATTGFALEDSQGSRSNYWYRVPVEHRGAFTESCDPFVLASLFAAMHAPAELQVHGSVSPSLVRNLEEYQAIWQAWLPDRYQPVEIRAESEQEAGRAAGSAAVMTFSGGLDSSFTAWRHRTGHAGRQTEALQAGVILHGFDIPINSKKAFDVAFDRSRIMLDSLGMETIPLTTNLRGMGGVLHDNFAAVLASCLSLLQKRFSVGLIANSDPDYVLVNTWAWPYGSNPLSDWFLSSNAFTIQHDGGGYSRFDKALALSGWPEAMSNLRVCLGHNPMVRVHNCCKCEKCIRNILIFRVLGLGLPACFKHDVSNRQILRMNYSQPARFASYSLMVEEAHQRGIRDSWVNALRLSLLMNRLLLPVRQSGIFSRGHNRPK